VQGGVNACLQAIASCCVRDRGGSLARARGGRWAWLEVDEIESAATVLLDQRDTRSLLSAAHKRLVLVQRANVRDLTRRIAPAADPPHFVPATRLAYSVHSSSSTSALDLDCGCVTCSLSTTGSGVSVIDGGGITTDEASDAADGSSGTDATASATGMEIGCVVE
jgi:hypothetical protein